MRRNFISCLHLVFLFITFFISNYLFSQPEHISFQSVIRDGNNKVIANKSITIRLSLLKNSQSGSTLYRETHTTTTSANGIVALLIGNGKTELGTFKNIDWANNNIFVKVEFDTNRANHKYIEVGTTQLLSVPYAIVAKTAQNAPQTQYTAGDGISIKNNTITNSKPNKEVSITGTKGIKVQGRYPSFTISNENTTGGGSESYYAGNGISIQNNTITNTLPDKILTLSGNNGIQVTGNYPSYIIGLSSTAQSLTAFDSTNLLINGARDVNPFSSDNSLNTVGARLLWYGDKAAFRAGWTVTSNDATNEIETTVWDCDNIGIFSTAFGNSNLASGVASFAAGKYNKVSSDNGFATGYLNVIEGSNSAAFGIRNNVIGESSLAIGNSNNLVGNNTFSTGIGNKVNAANSLTAGSNNMISGISSIASGDRNAVYDANSVAFGYYNTLLGHTNFAIGAQNRIEKPSSIAIGASCYVPESNAIAIGFVSVASGAYSFAIGTAANTNQKKGAMVLSDFSTIDSVIATADNQMTMRFAGGYKLFVNKNATLGVTLEPTGGGWAIMSDSNMKENFLPISSNNNFLDKILNLRLGTWNYKENALHNRHYGAMAQDIFVAFGKDSLGTIGNDTTINSGDMDGIMLIAIQELIKQNEAQQKTIEMLKTDIEKLKQKLSKK